MLRKIDKLELLKHIVFIVCVGIVSAFTSIVLCLCVNFAYHVNQTFAWTLFFLPLLGVLSLALYKAFKLPYDYSTDTLVEQMRNNDVVSPALAPGIIVGTCLTILGGGAVGKRQLLRLPADLIGQRAGNDGALLCRDGRPGQYRDGKTAEQHRKGE